MKLPRWTLIALVAALGIALGIATGVALGERRADALRTQNKQALRRLVDANELLMDWVVQLESSGTTEPASPVRTPGVYLARIVGVSDSGGELTFEWVGLAADGSVTDQHRTPQTLKLDPFPGAVMVQRPFADTDVRYVVGGTQTLPTKTDPVEFYESLRSGDSTGRAYLDSLWWVTVTSHKSFGIIQQRNEFSVAPESS